MRCGVAATRRRTPRCPARHRTGRPPGAGRAPPPTKPPLPTATWITGSLRVQNRAVHGDLQARARRRRPAHARERRADDVADGAEGLLQRPCRLGCLGADADVRDVDDDLVLAVDDQVDLSGMTGDDDARRPAPDRPAGRASRRSHCRCPAARARRSRRRGVRPCGAQSTTACRLPSPPSTMTPSTLGCAAEGVVEIMWRRRRDELDIVRLTQRGDDDLRWPRSSAVPASAFAMAREGP